MAFTFYFTSLQLFTQLLWSPPCRAIFSPRFKLDLWEIPRVFFHRSRLAVVVLDVIQFFPFLFYNRSTYEHHIQLHSHKQLLYRRNVAARCIIHVYDGLRSTPTCCGCVELQPPGLTLDTSSPCRPLPPTCISDGWTVPFSLSFKILGMDPKGHVWLRTRIVRFGWGPNKKLLFV